MDFSAIPPGASIFLDANVFVYDFSPDPIYGPPARSLLKRIVFGHVQGYLSTHTFSEVSHRLMTLEACQTFGWPYAGIAMRLRRHSVEIQKLQKFRKALDDITAIGLQFLSVDAKDILTAGDLSLQHGLLSGDALLLAIMQKNGLNQLASKDSDFDRIPGITRYSPV